MKRIVTRVLTVAAVATALLFSGTAVAQAAPAAAAECLTVSEAYDWGQGEITFCPNADGTTRISGWIQDLRPHRPFADDCVEWFAKLANGGSTSVAWVCYDLHDTFYREFDYARRLASPAVGAALAQTWF
jgi:hypothetical protein